MYPQVIGYLFMAVHSLNSPELSKADVLSRQAREQLPRKFNLLSPFSSRFLYKRHSEEGQRVDPVCKL